MDLYGGKGFIFMLEREYVNHPKNGDGCICIGEKGFILPILETTSRTTYLGIVHCLLREV